MRDQLDTRQAHPADSADIDAITAECATADVGKAIPAAERCTTSPRRWPRELPPEYVTVRSCLSARLVRRSP